MLKNTFFHTSENVYGRRALSCFSVVAYAQQQKISLNIQKCYIETSDGADKGASCCKCGI